MADYPEAGQIPDPFIEEDPKPDDSSNDGEEKPETSGENPELAPSRPTSSRPKSSRPASSKEVCIQYIIFLARWFYSSRFSIIFFQTLPSHWDGSEVYLYCITYFYL